MMSVMTVADRHVPQPLGRRLLTEVQRRPERLRSVRPRLVQRAAQRQAAGRLQGQQLVVRPERRRFSVPLEVRLIRWVEICAVGSGRIAIEFDCRRDLEASCLKPKGQASASSE